MIKELKQSFFQVFTISVLLEWLILQFFEIKTLQFTHLVGIAGLYALAFGIIYPLLWNYLTFIPAINVMLSTIFLIPIMAGIIYLIHPTLLKVINIYGWLGIIFVTLCLHGFIYYLISKNDYSKRVQELNQMLS